MFFSNKDDCYMGLSTETKPSNVDDGTKYLAVDTGDLYIYYNGTWYPQ